jgi:hypothetical protein
MQRGDFIMRTTIATLLLASAALSIAGMGASAQTRRHHAVRSQTIEAYDTSSLNSLPLTVNRRSWLDSGNVVHSGSTSLGGQSYMAASTQFNKTPDRVYAPDTFGNDVMTGQPYVPGRSVHLVEFSSLPNGGATLDNVIGRQNYYFNPASPQAPSPSRAAEVPVFPQEPFSPVD